MQVISTSKAPAAIGPYSQAIRIDRIVYTSGQIPLTATGQLVQGGIVEQTEQVLENIKEVLATAGCSLQNVIKSTVFIKDMNQFPAINEVYARYFGDHKPARSTVEVSRLPRDVLVEIEVIAFIE